MHMNPYIPAGVMPLASTFDIVSASPLCSLYFSAKLRGYRPVYLGRRRSGSCDSSGFVLESTVRREHVVTLESIRKAAIEAREMKKEQHIRDVNVIVVVTCRQVDGWDNGFDFRSIVAGSPASFQRWVQSMQINHSFQN